MGEPTEQVCSKITCIGGLELALLSTISSNQFCQMQGCLGAAALHMSIHAIYLALLLCQRNYQNDPFRIEQARRQISLQNVFDRSRLRRATWACEAFRRYRTRSPLRLRMLRL
jgi:hypothetical protein